MNFRGRNKVSPDFNMSSMTDIVFLLLIFFMITSTMVTTNALDLVLPKAKGKTDSNRSVAVSIDKNMIFYIDKTKVDELALENQLLSVLEGNENRSIIVRAEEGVPVEKVVFVLDIANRNQLKTVLAVRPQ
ncbi:MAG: biopolymer transporter ExbD [Flavobacteriales bacterium]|nr:biopolymer transporter ExbD [Flavobacteriales bacterium]